MLETYTCWADDPEATWEVECFDAGTAAEKYAQHRYENGDYDAAHAQSLDIHVQGKDGIQRFTIQIQMEPVFYATEVYD
jgi:hypothetical protein